MHGIIFDNFSFSDHTPGLFHCRISQLSLLDVILQQIVPIAGFSSWQDSVSIPTWPGHGLWRMCQLGLSLWVFVVGSAVGAVWKVLCWKGTCKPGSSLSNTCIDISTVKHRCKLMRFVLASLRQMATKPVFILSAFCLRNVKAQLLFYFCFGHRYLC